MAELAEFEARAFLVSAPKPAVSRTAFVRRKWAFIGLFGGMLSIAVSLGVPVCPMAASLGVPCPGCGLTRATWELLSGNGAAAFHLHPLVIPIVPLAVAFTLRALLADFGAARWLGRSVPRVSTQLSHSLQTAFSWALLAALIGVWLARFAGLLGGPVATTTFAAWLAQHPKF